MAIRPADKKRSHDGAKTVRPAKKQTASKKAVANGSAKASKAPAKKRTASKKAVANGSPKATKTSAKQAAKTPRNAASKAKAAAAPKAKPPRAKNAAKAPAAPDEARHQIIPAQPHVRAQAVAQRIDGLLAAGQRPVVVLFNDPATSLQPESRPEATFIDLTGVPTQPTDNVRQLTSRVFLEMALVHIRKAIQDGSRHVVVDDVATMEFYCGGGPTQAFTHALVAGLHLSDAGCDLFVTEHEENSRLVQELPQWIG